MMLILYWKIELGLYFIFNMVEDISRYDYIYDVKMYLVIFFFLKILLYLCGFMMVIYCLIDNSR